MRPQLAAIAAQQFGIFKREQALSNGYSEKEFRVMRARGGPWVRIRYAMYIERDIWEAGSPLDQAILRDRAALLVCDPGTVLSHSSAARALGLPCDEDDGLAHVTRLAASQTSRKEAGVKHHIAQLPPDEVAESHWLSWTTEIRTVIDLAREFGYMSGLVAADAALLRGLAKSDLIAYAKLHETETHAPTVSAVAHDAEPKTQSPHETRTRVTLIAIGITDLIPQVRFRLPGGGHAEVDFYSPSLNHVFESDGKVKYTRPLDAGGNPISPSEKLWLEKQREDQLRGLGLGVSRVIPRDTLPANLERTRARIWAEIDAQRGRDHGQPRILSA
jgi:hypothetical protein